MSEASGTAHLYCVYCGLPAGRPKRERAGTPSDVYCCIGCRLAHSISASPQAEGDSRVALARLGVAIFFSMNVMVFTMALWAWDVYEMDDVRSATVLHDLMRYACLMFATPVLLLLGEPLLQSAIDSVLERRMNTDVLMVCGVIASYIYSLISLFGDEPHVYFEVTCMILVAVTLGRWLEAKGKQRASEGLRSLSSLIPETARRVTEDGEQEVLVAAAQPGDLLRVAAHERIPVDGTVERNDVLVDTQVMTGESEPRIQVIGSEVRGGTLNLQHELFLRVTNSVSSGTISRMLDSITEAAYRQGKYQRFADRLATGLVPVIAVLAMATFVMQSAIHETHEALLASLAVVLIACPCAFGIATPLAIWASLAVAARHQILFRDGDAITKLASVRAIVFDKTGTLTGGTLQLHAQQYMDDSAKASADGMAMRLAQASSHWLAKNLVATLSATCNAQRLPEVSGVHDIPGSGVQGVDVATGREVLLGSLAFAEQRGCRVSDHLSCNLPDRNVATVVCVAWDGAVRALYSFREQLRPEAPDAVARLTRERIHAELLSGDSNERARAVAATLGIDYKAVMTPDGKRTRIEAIQANLGPVAMVGDGVNDAPALAAANVGIALDCGTDVSRDVADVCLLGSSLERLPWAIRLAKDTRNTIRLNLFWAVAYNVIGIGFAMAGYLTPVFAAIAMVGSSLFVISNSLRLAARHWDEGVEPGTPSSVPLMSNTKDSNATPALETNARESLTHV